MDLFRQLPVEEKSAKSKRRQLRKSVKSDERALGLACVEGVLGHVVMFGMPRHIQVVLLNVLAGLDHQVRRSCDSISIYRIAGNFRGTKYSWLSRFCHFVDIIFVVAACTAGKGRQGHFIVGKFSWSDFQPRKPRIFCPTKITLYIR